MIRRLTPGDNDILLKYVKRESELNLFIIGDVENFGYDKDFMKLWGEFDRGGRLIGVLLKYYNSFVFYSREDFFKEGFFAIMNTEGFDILSGEKTIIEKLAGQHEFSNKRDTYLCKLDNKAGFGGTDHSYMVRRIGDTDLDKVVDSITELYALIDEFQAKQSKEELKNKLASSSGRAFYIEEDGKIVSIAQTTAENSMSAMIVGVCTHPGYRQQGYASACVACLCNELLHEGKTLCLFYDNPKAGSIYKRLGFYDIGTWSIYQR